MIEAIERRCSLRAEKLQGETERKKKAFIDDFDKRQLDLQERRAHLLEELKQAEAVCAR